MARTSDFPEESYSKSFSDLLRSMAADLQPGGIDAERLLPSRDRGPWTIRSNQIVAALGMGDFNYGFSRLGLSTEVASDFANAEGRTRMRLSIFGRLPNKIRKMILGYLSPGFSLGSELVEGFADINSAARAVADITEGWTIVDEVGWAEWSEELGTFCYTKYKKFPAAPFAWMQFHDLQPTWLYFSDIRGVLPPPQEEPVPEEVSWEGGGEDSFEDWYAMYADIADPRHPQFSEEAYERAWEGV